MNRLFQSTLLGLLATSLSGCIVLSPGHRGGHYGHSEVRVGVPVPAVVIRGHSHRYGDRYDRYDRYDDREYRGPRRY